MRGAGVVGWQIPWRRRGPCELLAASSGFSQALGVQAGVCDHRGRWLSHSSVLPSITTTPCCAEATRRSLVPATHRIPCWAMSTQRVSPSPAPGEATCPSPHSPGNDAEACQRHTVRELMARDWHLLPAAAGLSPRVQRSAAPPGPRSSPRNPRSSGTSSAANAPSALGHCLFPFTPRIVMIL